MQYGLRNKISAHIFSQLWFYLIAVIIIASCTKEKITVYSVYAKNSTNHQIKIVPYFSGVIDNAKILFLNPGDSIKFAYGFERGIVNHGGFGSGLFSGISSNDSVVILFDNLYSISHYLNTPSSLAPKYYLHSSLRNFGNYLSWEYSADDISKNKREAFYLYKFIEQDYLDAR